ncbi:AAA family ATPase [Thiorhodococcus mannitoliphagus]|uniref:AAA family ATPase n=1 Tax=Thiorhodococcus mannitoliphagus TaxID=329406 RepID=A0A6P1DY00_9GAMM|nr:AAA family ATPase [Thiorhodococcus mannitoliphagus]NEX21012.1 AAA family ATPase [Thiorhodococcus mannitoliphagus]
MTPTTPDTQQPSPEIIAVVSQEAGVGKTTTAVNLALALAAAGRTVLLMDLDPAGRAGQALAPGALDRGGSERMLREAQISRDMIVGTSIPDIYVAQASAGLSDLGSELAPMGDCLTRLFQAIGTIHSLSLDFEHVVIDCPSSLSLLTLNALTAAHRVLVPLPCDPAVLEGLPTLLKDISRLRANLAQPLYGVSLLMSLCDRDGSTHDFIATVRHEYGRMTLLTEIPLDEAVQEAAEAGRPLLVQCSSCEVSLAFQSLGSEWLTLSEQGDQPDGTWRFKARQDRMARYREDMGRNIEAWLVDPTSRLYDAEAASRHQDTQAMEELFAATQPVSRARLGVRPLLVILLAGVLILLPAALWLGSWATAQEDWRIELGARLIGSDRFWNAGSLLLARSDANAYRELLYAIRLVEGNRERLRACGEGASVDGSTECVIRVQTR